MPVIDFPKRKKIAHMLEHKDKRAQQNSGLSCHQNTRRLPSGSNPNSVLAPKQTLAVCQLSLSVHLQASSACQSRAILLIWKSIPMTFSVKFDQWSQSNTSGTLKQQPSSQRFWIFEWFGTLMQATSTFSAW